VPLSAWEALFAPSDDQKSALALVRATKDPCQYREGQPIQVTTAQVAKVKTRRVHRKTIRSVRVASYLTSQNRTTAMRARRIHYQKINTTAFPKVNSKHLRTPLRRGVRRNGHCSRESLEEVNNGNFSSLLTRGVSLSPDVHHLIRKKNVLTTTGRDSMLVEQRSMQTIECLVRVVAIGVESLETDHGSQRRCGISCFLLLRPEPERFITLPKSASIGCIVPENRLT
jgi:hypothetical protein